MNTLKNFLSVACLFITITAMGQDKTDSFKVYGNCSMCKKRIEKAAKTDAVSSVAWNVDTKMMTVTYDAKKIGNIDIQKRIAAVGHDTEKCNASDKVYDALPGCCLYERKTSSKQSSH